MAGNYSQVDREVTAVKAGVKKITIIYITENFPWNFPLLGIFYTDNPTPPILSTVMLCLSIFLKAYKFDIINRAGKKMGNDDCLCRVPGETAAFRN